MSLWECRGAFLAPQKTVPGEIFRQKGRQIFRERLLVLNVLPLHVVVHLKQRDTKELRMTSAKCYSDFLAWHHIRISVTGLIVLAV